MRKNQGFSLLELLLVLVVITSIVIGTLRLVRFHQHEIFVEQQKEALSMTLLLMNQYYLNHCHDDLSATSLKDLTDWVGTITPPPFSAHELAMIPANFSIQYVGTIVRIPTPHTQYKFVVSGNYSTFNAQQIQQLAGELNADNATNPLTWARVPRQFVFKETTVDSLWIASMNMQAKLLSADHSGNACP